MLPARSRLCFTCSSCKQTYSPSLAAPCWGVVPPSGQANTRAQRLGAARQPCREAVTPQPASFPNHLHHRLQWELCLLLAALPASPALAEEALAYNPEGGSQLIKALSGIGYVALLGYFLFRVLNRRARTAREERIAGQGPIVTPFTPVIEKARQNAQPKLTPATALIGSLQAGGIALGLWIFTTKVETIIGTSDLPAGYTAHNMAVTVRTIIIGLLYLVTFIFSANTVGLAGLAVQLLVWPDSVKDDEPRPEKPQGPVLPKVTVTSSPDEIRRAFDSLSSTDESTGRSL